MRRTPSYFQAIVHIENATFYRQHPLAQELSPSPSSPPLFKGLTFELPAKPLINGGAAGKQQHWAIIGASGNTTFLEVLRSSHLCFPPNARTFPYLSSDEVAAKDQRLRTPMHAIQHVGFNRGKGLGSGIRGPYLSARYESRREEGDWSLAQYLKGDTDLNPWEEGDEGKRAHDDGLLGQVITDLKLEKLMSMPISNLSNGQTRRARIAKALLGRPELLLLDEPFMGLDPPTLVSLSSILRELAYKSSPRLLLALRPQDPIPDWTTHLVILGANYTVALMGSKPEVLFALHRWREGINQVTSKVMVRKMASMMTESFGTPPAEFGMSLTAEGVVPYEAYGKMIAESEYFDVFGRIRRAQVSSERQKEFSAAHKKPIAQQTLSDLLILTATPPSSLENGVPIRTSAGGKFSSKQSEKARPVSMSALSSTLEQAVMGEPLIELSGIVVKYGEKVVLGAPAQGKLPRSSSTTNPAPALHLTIRQGTRLALLGPNGSGKTTLLSLLTSDHPHSYSLPIKFFGRSRLPSPGRPGLSLWDIQSRIGHSSPEIHAFFPTHLSVRRVLESAWADTFSAKPNLTFERDRLVDAMLRWWEPELRGIRQPDQRRAELLARGPNEGRPPTGNVQPAFWELVSHSSPPPIGPRPETQDQLTLDKDTDLEWAESSSPSSTFGGLPIGTQRLLLLLRAIIKSPDILILDEAFSGLSPEVRDKAMLFLSRGETAFYSHILPTYPAPRSRQPKESEQQRYDTAELENQRPILERVARSVGFADATALVLSRGSQAPTKQEQAMYKRISQMTRDELFAAAAQYEAANQGRSEMDVGFGFTGLSGRQALVVVSHVKEEVPGIVNEWLRLPGEEEILETGRGVEMGRCREGAIRTTRGWRRVWGF